MSILDDDLDINSGDLLLNHFKNLMLFDSSKSLYNEFRNANVYNIWRNLKTGEVKSSDITDIDIKIITPENIPNRFIIGYDRLHTNNINRLTIRLFDPSKIIVLPDKVIYKDEIGKLQYRFNKNSLTGYFGNFRLITNTIKIGDGDERICSLIIELDEVLEESINNRHYIEIPNTSMEIGWEFHRQLNEQDQTLPIYEQISLNKKESWKYLI